MVNPRRLSHLVCLGSIISSYTVLVSSEKETWGRSHGEIRRRTQLFSENRPFEVIVLAGQEPSRLVRLLNSILSTEGVDSGSELLSVEIRIQGKDQQKQALSELVAKGFNLPPPFEKTVTLCESNYDHEESFDRPGNLQSWLDAWPEADDSGRAIILDETVELSPLWYKYVKDAWARYSDHEDLAGISLMPQVLTTSVKTPMKPLPIVNNHDPFLYPMITSPTNAFSPHPHRWREFLSWMKDIRPAQDTMLKSNLPPSLLSAFLKVKDYDEIFFYHTRKAGGLTIQLFLKKLAKNLGKNITSVEGLLCPSKYMSHNKHPEYSSYLENPRILSVTALRDPVERALSQYFFAGRWRAIDKVMDKKDEVDFNTWLESMLKKQTPCNNGGKSCWDCASQCYARWFGGDGTGGYNVTRAIEVLESFDIVLNTDDLTHEPYRGAMEQMLGAEPGTFIPRHGTDPSRKEGVIISEEQRERLSSVNVEDDFIVETVTGISRRSELASTTQRAMNSFLDEMVDTKNSWKMWTQLFSYWCHLNGYNILYISPQGGKVMATLSDVDEVSMLAPELLSGEFVFSWPLELQKYNLDGTAAGTVPSAATSL